MRWLTRPFGRRRRLDPWSLDTTLLHWSAGAPWSLGDACQGTCILGSSGAGKSTGSFSATCGSFLRAGFGGIFLTVKPEDAKTYIKLIRENGRLNDLVMFSPEHTLRYNFIADEMQHGSDGPGLAENLTGLILSAVELLNRSKGGGGGGENAEYFKNESSRLLRNAILLLLVARGTVTMTDLHKLIVSAPQSDSDLASETWQQSSFCMQVTREAERAPKSASLQADFELAVTFFLNEWPALSSRTRSSVQSTLTSATDLLSRGLIRDMLSAPHSNFSPSMLYDGSVVIVDFPVLKYNLMGQLLQVIVKFACQRAHARRDVTTNNRPTFISADEAQFLLVDSDQHFQAISRSTRTAVVYATQGISSMLDAFGPRSEDKVHSLLCNLATRICHQQTDVRTVEYMQQLVGRSRQWLMSGQSPAASDWVGTILGQSSGGSAGFAEAYECELQAEDLNSLAKGGPPRWLTEAIVYRGGQRFPSGKTWARVAFPQTR